MFKSKEVDMLNGSLWDKLIIFAIPVALTIVMQQLFNTADIAVLGQYVGKNAIAAVGNNISLIGLLVNLFMGLSLGANVIIAQSIGARRLHVAHATVSTAFIFSLIFGVIIAIIGEIFTDSVLKYMEVPDEVFDMAEIYFRIYLIGLPAIGLYNFEAAIFRSQGDTKTPLISLTISSILNIILNLISVAIFNLGVAGVACSTVIANFVSALILFRALILAGGVIHLDLNVLTFKKKLLAEIIRIGLPAGIQGMVFSISNLLIQSAINSLGANAMAASAAAFTIEINVYCIMNGFSQATTTFVSQNYGANKLKRCKQITWLSMSLNAFFMIIASVFILSFGETLLSFFNEDSKVIELGMIRLWYIVAPQLICVLLEGLSATLRGYGISLAPALMTLFGVCGVRITWLFTAFQLEPTYETLMTVYPLSWLVTSILLCIAYKFYMKNLKAIKLL